MEMLTFVMHVGVVENKCVDIVKSQDDIKKSLVVIKKT